VLPQERRNIFTVHAQYGIYLAPAGTALDKKAKNFADIFALGSNPANHITMWQRDEHPAESDGPNFLPVGFTGCTGYYKQPGSSATPSTQSSVSRGVDFRITYSHPQSSTLDAQIAINDNRATPKAVDNKFKVNAIVARDVFQLIPLGKPQGGSQAWLALLVDSFDQPAEKIPVPNLKFSPDGTSDIHFTSTDGRQVDTTKMRGKVILIDFWATWCGFCVECMPQVQDLYTKYHQGFDVIGVSLDSDRGRFDAFLKDHPHPWSQSFSGGMGSNPIFDPLGAQGIPVFILIDKKGQATAIDVRNPDTNDIILAKLKG
jgi:thiol-disulfide isomerase/thioredoxin